MTNKQITIYRIFNIVDGKSYIGQTVNLDRRIKAHFSNLQTGFHGSTRLRVAYKTHGQKLLNFEVLETDVAPENANEREIFWIAHFNSYHDGYNNTKGGSNGHLKECSPAYYAATDEINRLRKVGLEKRLQVMELEREIKELNLAIKNIEKQRRNIRNGKNA